MRLTIPEPEIDLYSDGFDEHDKLSRKSTGDKLSELVERIDDPLVIALDGAWGSGKSFFLKCWVGEHLKREGNTTQTVYFDAFKHDFLDDPLIALTGAIAERFEETKDEAAQKAWKTAKRVAPTLGRALVRTGASVVTAGLVTKADELAEAAIKAVSGELDEAVADFWKIENGKRAAMEGFRRALVDLTEPDASGTPNRKLIVVIDELDRCRPDFALSVLETIKHFFDVAGIQFVLGVNLVELQNSVRARYGGQTNANAYLQKFIHVQFRLPIETGKASATTLSKYLALVAEHTKSKNTQGVGLLNLYTKHGSAIRELTLRDAERVCALASIAAPIDTDWGGKYAAWLVPGLILIKIKRPELYTSLRAGKLPKSEVLEQLGLERVELDEQSRPRDGQRHVLILIWNYYLDPDFGNKAVLGQSELNFENDFVPDDLRNVPRTELLSTLIYDYLEVFMPLNNR